ncbi:MAG: hypothetical protein K0R99_2997 [Microbacterium sp.]|jgi:hypothetical protein|nr:hypothetical protein [Microbacterium sp.]
MEMLQAVVDGADMMLTYHRKNFSLILSTRKAQWPVARCQTWITENKLTPGERVIAGAPGSAPRVWH